MNVIQFKAKRSKQSSCSNMDVLTPLSQPSRNSSKVTHLVPSTSKEKLCREAALDILLKEAEALDEA
ncbi:hypothetical protein [Motiliproteus sp. MSK22-1]|uniref:hypothetical protein n=1 Tax=Motiliproteus sp. MSK22-1 TaxID=1897630 RepID=UPI00117D0ED0|nr:hypothetical protein [Motiliproteus sp. MSK22-1]